MIPGSKLFVGRGATIKANRAELQRKAILTSASSHPFLTIARVASDDPRVACRYVGVDGNRLCTTDGHRLHFMTSSVNSDIKGWQCLDTRPEDKDARFPEVDNLLSSFKVEQPVRLKLDVAQRRALKIVCHAAKGAEVQYKEEWKKLKKKERDRFSWSRVFVHFSVGDFDAFAGMTGPGFDVPKMAFLGEQPEQKVDATSIHVDGDYLLDVLTTLPISDDKTYHTTISMKRVEVPEELLVIELDGENDKAPIKIYAEPRPNDFALISPVSK